MTKVNVSFSGGRTSAFMLRRILDDERYDEVVVTFVNTGQEDERTLAFVDRCDREWRANVVWLEAVVYPERGRSTGFKVVDFETASRQGEPFESVIGKYGIPNQNYPHCTRELKLRPMAAYLKSIGWTPGSYDVAVGIRADEMDRVGSNPGIVYPLVDGRVRKADVLAWWKTQPFDLTVPEHFGNCVWCWKKSLRKLSTVAAERPNAFAFPARMEALHAHTGAGTGPRLFFRGNRTATEILAGASGPGFVPFTDVNAAFDPDLDVGGGCSDSCEALQ